MFEDSLVESRVGYVSASKRWTALASISLQFAVAAVVITLPLLHPEALSFHPDTPKVVLPLSSKAPVTIVRVERTSAASISLGTTTVVRAVSLPSLLPSRISAMTDAPAFASIDAGMGMHTDLPAGISIDEAGRGRNIIIAPTRAAAGPLHISLGVSQGMLLAPIRPVYPAIAKAAHVEGTVIVEAIISSAGRIESARVISGPPMLQRAAIDAIQAARYKPYRLNGEVTTVETTITVNFRMAS